MATSMKNAPTTIDAYIASFPPDIQKILQQIRATVRKAAPKAEEAIRYAMPTFLQDGHLVLFAAFKNHIGFFPAPTGVASFKTALAPYKTGKGSVQFPLDQPMPVGLITNIVKYRIKKNAEAAGAKVAGKTKLVPGKKKAAKRKQA
jgi:uncharacterized protein YdhG (YjbR/CyaY superfamily)